MLMNGTDVNSTGSLALLRQQIAELQQTKEQFKRNLNLVDGKVRVIEVTNEVELKAFISLPYEIYKDNPAWPGQDDEEVLHFLNPETCPYSSLEIQPLIALRDGQPVGRICAIFNEEYNQHWNSNVGFFGFFECINDQEIANELLNAVESRLIERGKVGYYGPIYPTINEYVGFLMDNFDKVPAKGMAFNESYYCELVSNFGLNKAKDFLQPAVSLDQMEQQLEKRMHKLEPFIDDPNIYIRCFDWDNLDEDAEIFRDLLYNQTFAGHWGYYPIDPVDWRNVMAMYRPYVHEDSVIILEDNGEPIALGLCFIDTNFNQVGEDGKPLKRIKWDIIGIKPDYHRNGLGTYIVYCMLPVFRAHGTDIVTTSWVLEDNQNSLGLCRCLGMENQASYRVYEKMF